MKKNIFLTLVITLFFNGCAQEKVPKPDSWKFPKVIESARAIAPTNIEGRVFGKFGLAYPLKVYNEIDVGNMSITELAKYADIVTHAYPDASYKISSKKEIDVKKVRSSAFANIAYIALYAKNPNVRQDAKEYFQKMQEKYNSNTNFTLNNQIITVKSGGVLETNFEQKNREEVELYGKKWSNISLKAEPFSFKSSYDDLRMCVNFEYSESLEVFDKTKEMDINTPSCFGLGTYYAMYKNDTTLYFRRVGSHSLNSSHGLKKINDEYAYNVNKFSIDGFIEAGYKNKKIVWHKFKKKLPIKEFQNTKFYSVIWIDSNKNKVAEEGEFKYYIFHLQ